MSNDNDLIERYLYAITRHLPAEQRADVAEELRTLISDMLDERCGGLAPTPKDVRVVLTELGTPAEMVRKYTNGEGKCLIGQPYYSQYIAVLKLVLICVTGGMAVAGILSMLVEPGDNLALQAVEGVGGWIAALSFAFSFVTVLFAVFSRKGIEVDVSMMGSLDDLPPVPREAKPSTRGDAVAGIVFSVLGAAVLLLLPDVLNALSHRGDGVPFDAFNVAAIRASAWVIIAWKLICVAAESFKLVEGRYSTRLLAVTLVSDALAAVLVVFWLTNFQIVDGTAVMQALESSGDPLNGPVRWAVMNIQTAFCGLVLVALAIDAVDATVRTFKAAR